jgi:CelD/BcsL family acetyltransferase involved in cellulose biosynthesis
MNSAVPRYRAAAMASLDEFLQRAQALQGPTCLPFHGAAWLRAWYDTLGSSDGRQPLWVGVQRQTADGWTDAMLLPLVRLRRHGLSELALADAGVVDYVAPLTAADWHGGAHEAPAARALWTALAQALGGYDVWTVEKMLPAALSEAGATTNPLALAWRTQAGEMFGNQFCVGESWEAWRRGLDKRVRKEIERCWRVFERSPVARFERVTDPERAHALFDTLERQQSERMAEVPYYQLDRAPYRAFYRQLLGAGLADGSVVLTALLDGDEVVSALFGVANGSRYIALRQSIGGDAWKACSPGRLLDEGTARHMHEQGLGTFDFGVGDYFHKTTLGMTRIPLRDACVALSWRGLPVVWAWRLRRRIKQIVKNPQTAQARLLAPLLALRRRWLAVSHGPFHGPTA